MNEYFYNKITGRTVVAAVTTFGCKCNRDIIRRLMGSCHFFKGLTFAQAVDTYRTAERNGWIRKANDAVVVEWCFD